MDKIFWDSKRQEYTIQSTSLPSQRLVGPPQVITALPRWRRKTLLHQFFSHNINLTLTHPSRCATLLQWVSRWLNNFAECSHTSSQLMLVLLTNPSLKAPSSSLFSNRRVTLSRMQQLLNHLVDLHLFCPHLPNIKQTVSMLFIRPSNSSTNTWRQNTLIARHYNLLTFNCKKTSPYCATRFSPIKILPLKTPLPVLYLTQTLTLFPLHQPSHFPALLNLHFVVLPRWAMWDHPERKQTTP